MTIAIHRRFRKQRTIIGIGVAAVLAMATVAALQFNSRPVTVTDDPAPAVTQMPQNEGLESIPGAGNASSLWDTEVHQKWLESIQGAGTQSLWDAEVHQKWLESIQGAGNAPSLWDAEVHQKWLETIQPG